MSSHSLQSGDALLSITQKPALVVKVDELSIESPTAEAAEIVSRRVEFGKTATMLHEDDLKHFTVPVARSRTIQVGEEAMSASSVQRSSSHEVLRCPKGEDDSDVNTLSRRRTHKMQLPSFETLGIASSDSAYFGRRPTLPAERHSGPSTRPSLQAGRAAAHSLPLPPSENSRPLLLNLGNTPLLTPPEDADSIKWNNALLQNPAHSSGGQPSSTSQSVSIAMASKFSGDQQQAGPSSSSASQSEEARSERSQQGATTEQTAQQQVHESALARTIRPFSKHSTSGHGMAALT